MVSQICLETGRFEKRSHSCQIIAHTKVRHFADLSPINFHFNWKIWMRFLGFLAYISIIFVVPIAGLICCDSERNNF